MPGLAGSVVHRHLVGTNAEHAKCQHVEPRGPRTTSSVADPTRRQTHVAVNAPTPSGAPAPPLHLHPQYRSIGVGTLTGAFSSAYGVRLSCGAELERSQIEDYLKNRAAFDAPRPHEERTLHIVHAPPASSALARARFLRQLCSEGVPSRPDIRPHA